MINVIIILCVDSIFRRRFVAVDFHVQTNANQSPERDDKKVKKRNADPKHQHEDPSLGFACGLDLAERRHGRRRSVVRVLTARRHHQRGRLENGDVAAGNASEDSRDDGRGNDGGRHNRRWWKLFRVGAAEREGAGDRLRVVVADGGSGGRFVSEHCCGHRRLRRAVSALAGVVGAERMNARS